MSHLMPRRLIVLMALMTAATFCGPLVIGLVLRGGPDPAWPPDRAIEWWTLAGTSALVLSLMSITVAASIAAQRQERRAKLKRASSKPERAPEPPSRESTKERRTPL